MNLEVDHVVLCVEDLDRAVGEIEDSSLTAIPGGRHQGHGTENRIVPLGSAYLELVAVVDPREASRSVFGQWVGAKASDTLRSHGVCLRTGDLDALCDRLGLKPTAMSRRKPDGSELKWRLAGLEAMVTRGLPFFIEWDVAPEDHPGWASGISGAVDVTLSGVVDQLLEWVTPSSGISVVEGSPGSISAVVTMNTDKIVF